MTSTAASSSSRTEQPDGRPAFCDIAPGGTSTDRRTPRLSKAWEAWDAFGVTVFRRWGERSSS